MRFVIVLLLPLAAWAQIWPETFGPYKRVGAEPAFIADRPLWNEYGLQASETARYEADGKSFKTTAWRLQDSTAAMAAFEWQRPADAKPSQVAKISADTKDGLLLVHGNYLLSIQGYQPKAGEIVPVVEALPRVENAPLPTLRDYLPAKDLVPNSERYVTGPVGLERFFPGVPPSVAGFRFGAEAQLGVFHGPAGDMKLAIFDYLTPQIAMEQYEGFSKLPGAMAKRSGPLIAVVLSPPNPDAAERLLADVRYQAAVTLSERVPTRKDNIGDLVINAFELIGVLLVFAAVSGIAFGGLRVLVRRGPKGQEGDP
ncbi:MAG: hypothetical protein M1436_05610, partial [Acidobacteria bacterium]|nr:hypothetical protein [Acidobacteriota bacterium]